MTRKKRDGLQHRRCAVGFAGTRVPLRKSGDGRRACHSDLARGLGSTRRLRGEKPDARPLGLGGRRLRLPLWRVPGDGGPGCDKHTRRPSLRRVGRTGDCRPPKMCHHDMISAVETCGAYNPMGSKCQAKCASLAGQVYVQPPTPHGPSLRASRSNPARPLDCHGASRLAMTASKDRYRRPFGR